MRRRTAPSAFLCACSGAGWLGVRKIYLKNERALSYCCFVFSPLIMPCLTSANLSQSRSLLRDLSDGLAQQMIFWGHDVRHSEGNRLVRFGMQRMERDSSQTEGSSRYRMDWECGVVELHGFCVGWYPDSPEAEGTIFIRNRGRILSTSGEEFQQPGAYESSRLGWLAPDELLHRVVPFVSWWIAYEEWIADATPPAYREACWKGARHLGKSKSWLRPPDALDWLRQFVRDPSASKRARTKPKLSATPTLSLLPANHIRSRNPWQ